MRPERNKTLQAEIGRLDDLGLDDLRKLCDQILGYVPPHHGTALLRRRLAYELQARLHGATCWQMFGNASDACTRHSRPIPPTRPCRGEA